MRHLQINRGQQKVLRTQGLSRVVLNIAGDPALLVIEVLSGSAEGFDTGCVHPLQPDSKRMGQFANIHAMNPIGAIIRILPGYRYSNQAYRSKQTQQRRGLIHPKLIQRLCGVYQAWLQENKPLNLCLDNGKPFQSKAARCLVNH